MAQLISPRTGLLVCPEYLLFRQAGTGGPPHGISSSDYDSLLKDRDKATHYLPKRTHKVGKGSCDAISVWRRKESAKL